MADEEFDSSSDEEKNECKVVGSEILTLSENINNENLEKEIQINKDTDSVAASAGEALNLENKKSEIPNSNNEEANPEAVATTSAEVSYFLLFLMN